MHRFERIQNARVSNELIVIFRCLISRGQLKKLFENFSTGSIIIYSMSCDYNSMKLLKTRQEPISWRKDEICIIMWSRTIRGKIDTSMLQIQTFPEIKKWINWPTLFSSSLTKVISCFVHSCAAKDTRIRRNYLKSMNILFYYLFLRLTKARREKEEKSG